MIDFQVANGDIQLSNKDLSFVSGDDATIQRIKQKFRLWRGEWFLDTSAGVPWLRDVLGQRPREQIVSGIMRSVVSEDPGVDELLELTVDFDGNTREFTINFRARLTGGTTVTEDFSL